MNLILKVVGTFMLKALPLFRFHRLVVLAFRFKGYSISKSARIFSSVQMIGEVNISVGHESFIGHETILMGGKDSKIIIGNYCDISSRVNIITGTHEIDRIGDRTAGQGFSSSIFIGDGVWIGFGSQLLLGIKIGNKSIIAAGSVVTKDVDERTVVGGNPARVIKEL